ncbi:MAG: radical SAM protein [Cyanobacteria bacterium SIG29]|nr:radical SAM protein [Cyanobacteria bacterium SIG29]
MKALFIFPPFYSQFNINTGIPQIISFLKAKNYDVKALDLNIKFFNYLYNEKVLNNLLLETYEIYKNKDKYNLPCEYYKLLEEFFGNKKLVYKVHNAIKNIDNIKQSLKSKKGFIELFKNENNIITEITDIQKLSDFIFKDLTSYEDRKYFINDSVISTYESFLKLVIDDILKENYDYIGFSVNGDSQFISSIITAKLLKEKGYKGKIGLGGINIFKDLKIIKEDKSLFQKYIDVVIVGQGEYAHEEYFEYLNGERELKEVCNIIYLNENIFVNKEKYLSVNDYSIPCYDDYDFTEYMLPEPIFPIRASYGCYWGKCTFCAHYYNNKKHFFIRKVDDLIEEIKFYIKTYNVNTLCFVDSALPPKYLDEFATKIIEQKIKIYFMMQNRFEDDFDEVLLKKLHKAGLIHCFWGLESASPKILEKMNKGININTAQKILETAHSVGILNGIYWMYNFPEETIDDFNLTYNFIKKNIEYIDNVVDNRFMLPTFSYMYSNPKEFGLNEEIIKQVENNHKGSDCLDAEWLGIPMTTEAQNKVFEIQRLMMQKNKITIARSELITTLAKYKRNEDK